MRPPIRLIRKINKERKSKIIANLLILFKVKNKVTQKMCMKTLYTDLVYENGRQKNTTD